MAGNHDHPWRFLVQLQAPNHFLPANARKAQINNHQIFGIRCRLCQKTLRIGIAKRCMTKDTQNSGQGIRDRQIILDYVNTHGVLLSEFRLVQTA